MNTVFGQLKLLINHSQQLHRRLCAVVSEGGRGGGAGLEDESSDALFVRHKFSKSTLYGGFDIVNILSLHPPQVRRTRRHTHTHTHTRTRTLTHTHWGTDFSECRVLGVLEDAFAVLDVYQKYVERLGEAQSIADMWARDEEVFKV